MNKCNHHISWVFTSSNFQQIDWFVVIYNEYWILIWLMIIHLMASDNIWMLHTFLIYPSIRVNFQKPKSWKYILLIKGELFQTEETWTEIDCSKEILASNHSPEKKSIIVYLRESEIFDIIKHSIGVAWRRFCHAVIPSKTSPSPSSISPSATSETKK